MRLLLKKKEKIQSKVSTIIVSSHKIGSKTRRIFFFYEKEIIHNF